MSEQVHGTAAFSWYALRTKHQHEKSVTNVLAEKGFEVLCPTYAEVHRWKDRKKEVTLPLFPGYLFFANGLERKVDLLSTPVFATSFPSAIRRPLYRRQRSKPFSLRW